MLIDEVKITFMAGRGGDGAVTYYANRGKPSGGDGGRGGSVLARVSPSLSSLATYAGSRVLKAADGEHGSNFTRAGQNAEDLVVKFPIGTYLENLDTGEKVELPENGEPIIVASGGGGGWGNSTINKMRNNLFSKSNPGRGGEIVKVRAVMRLIANAGFIGFPNAGKSSLLNVITTTTSARVADYPFTTLEPNLGVIVGYKNGELHNFVLADIPGLIEGASMGRGLGFKFLKHVEKVELLIHCISCETQDAADDYTKIKRELEYYNASLIKKPEVILFTKSDLIAGDPQKQAQLEAFAKSLSLPYLFCSILDDAQVSAVKQMLLGALQK